MTFVVQAFTTVYPPHARVGAHLATHDVMAELARRGHKVRVDTLISQPPYTFEGVDVSDATFPPDTGADVVVHHVGGTERAVEFADLHDIPRVVMVHGMPQSGVWRDDPALWVAVSETAASSVESPSPVVVARPLTRAPEPVAGSGRKVTMVNCSRQKGADTLIRLVGSMFDVEFLAVRGAWGDQRVTMAPHLEVWPTQPDMSKVWAATRILLVPSITETWCMTAVEAMAHGIPVIAHPCDGLRESLGDAGIFVDRDDTTGWVDAIRSLDDLTYRDEMQRRGRERFASLPTDGPQIAADAIEVVCRGQIRSQSGRVPATAS